MHKGAFRVDPPVQHLIGRLLEKNPKFQLKSYLEYLSRILTRILDFVPAIVKLNVVYVF